MYNTESGITIEDALICKLAITIKFNELEILSIRGIKAVKSLERLASIEEVSRNFSMMVFNDIDIVKLCCYAYQN
jgi:hypothetical protein